MKSRWITVLAAALAVGAPLLPSASDVSREERRPQETQKEESKSNGNTGMQDMHGMSGMGAMQGMQDQGRGATGSEHHAMSCSCPCRGPNGSGGPHHS